MELSKLNFHLFLQRFFLLLDLRRYAIAEVDPATINEKIPERIIFPI